MSDELPPPTPEPPYEPAPPAPAAPPAAPPPEPPPPVYSGSSSFGGDPEPKDANEKTLGLVMHLLPLAGMLLMSFSIPLGNIVAPLILWLIKKDQSPYLDAHGKEVLNFQINVGVLSLVCFVLFVICIGVPMLFALYITALVLMVMAAIQVSEGKFYRYPWIYRVIK